MSLGHEFTQAEAAVQCGVSPITIRRKRESGQFPNAHQADSRGTWVIPMADLLAAGLNPGKPTSPDPTPTSPDPKQADAAELRATVEGLRGQLDERATRVQEVKAAADAQIETVRGHMLAIEESKNTAEQRVLDLTDTNKRLDERLSFVERAELETSKAFVQYQSDAEQAVKNWRTLSYGIGAILTLLLFLGLLVFFTTTG